MFLKILQNSQENTWAGISFLIKSQAACSFITKETLAQVFVCKSLFVRTPILKNWCNGGNWRGLSEENLEYLHIIKVSESSLKTFSEQKYIKAIRLCHSDKDWGLNWKQRN